MPRAAQRLDRWQGADNGSGGDRVLDDVRRHLDADLDTPSALEAIDEAVERGQDVTLAATLLGVDLDR
jgi:L-cysteine:1D-myo-inositol 2-amino-2-deoxy-alpha-D-glucopyranoside ligase